MSAVAEHPATMDSSHVPNDGANLHYRERVQIAGNTLHLEFPWSVAELPAAS